MLAWPGWPCTELADPVALALAGLKFGMYSDAGALTCLGYPGSRGHEEQDAAAFASWGVDYLKCVRPHGPWWML